MFRQIIIILVTISISSWAMNIPQAAVNHANSAHSSAFIPSSKKKFNCVYQKTDGQSINVVSNIYKSRGQGHYLSLTDDQAFTINREESKIYASEIGDISCEGIKGIELEGYWYFEVIEGPISLYKDLPKKGKIVMFKKDNIHYKEFDSDFENALSDKQEVLDYYQGMKSRKTVGNVLMWSGLGLTIAGIVMSLNENNSTGEFGEETSSSPEISPLVFLGVGASFGGYIISSTVNDGEYKAVVKYNF